MFLQLAPDNSAATASDKDLPLAIYESVVELVAGEAKPTFVPVPYEVVTGEAERVAVEGVSKPEAGADGGAQGNRKLPRAQALTALAGAALEHCRRG